MNRGMIRVAVTGALKKVVLMLRSHSSIGSLSVSQERCGGRGRGEGGGGQLLGKR